MATPTLDGLRESVLGPVIGSGDPGYEEARRVYNGMIDKRPLAVVRCADVADVITSVRFARENGLDLSIRSGGAHSAPGFGTNDGGIVADLGSMKSVRVDPGTQTARVEAGCTWGDFNHATYPFGLATTGGIVASTGVSGLTLGGGMGYLARGFGLSCDNLISADVITADGRFLVASEKENEDLFWALRGGGGNFGVATSLEFQLHPVKDIFAAIVFYPLDSGRDILEFYREYITTAPEQMGLFPAFQIAPPLPFIPEAEHGKTLMALIACWSGDLDEGEKAVEPIRKAAPVVGEMVGPMPYPAINSAFDPLVPSGLQAYWKGSFAKDLPDGVVAAHIEHGPKIPAVSSAMHIYSINGAVHRVPSDATAFAYRDATYATVIAGMWPDPADNAKNIAWVKDYYTAIEPHSETGGYINFMDGDDQTRIKENYRGNYKRLREIKKKYDPDNVFHMNQNIEPAK